MAEVFIVGDVGGTNTRLVLYEWDTATDKEGEPQHTRSRLRLLADSAAPSLVPSHTFPCLAPVSAACLQ